MPRLNQIMTSGGASSPDDPIGNLQCFQEVNLAAVAGSQTPDVLMVHA